MSAPTVAERPDLFDYYTLDGQRAPGVTEVTSGGDSPEDIDDQRQPLTTGANTVVRGTKNATITYEHTLWTVDDLQAWDRWEAMLLEGRKRTPKPRVYVIVDGRINKAIKRVIYENAGFQKRGKPGGPWMRTLMLHQYNRVVPYGGPLRPPDALDRQILANNATIADLSSRLAGPVAATRVGR